MAWSTLRAISALAAKGVVNVSNDHHGDVWTAQQGQGAPWPPGRRTMSPASSVSHPPSLVQIGMSVVDSDGANASPPPVTFARWLPTSPCLARGTVNQILHAGETARATWPRVRQSVLHRVVDDVEWHEPLSLPPHPCASTAIRTLHGLAHLPLPQIEPQQRPSMLRRASRSTDAHNSRWASSFDFKKLNMRVAIPEQDPKSAALGHVHVVALGSSVDLLGRPLFHAVPKCARTNHVCALEDFPCVRGTRRWSVEIANPSAHPYPEGTVNPYAVLRAAQSVRRKRSARYCLAQILGEGLARPPCRQ